MDNYICGVCNREAEYNEQLWFNEFDEQPICDSCVEKEVING